MKASERIVIDDATDSIAIDGIRMTMAALETLLLRETPKGVWFRVQKVNDPAGVIIIEQRSEVELFK